MSNSRTILVPISNRPSGNIQIDVSDLERLTLDGVNTAWQLNTNRHGQEYVRACKAGMKIMLGRLILNAPAGYIVTHLDGDRTNLTRTNLKLEPASRKRKASRVSN